MFPVTLKKKTKSSQPANAVVEWDKTYLWHPFTQMQDWVKEDPIIIERGEGCWLYDDQGRKYLDGVSSLWVTVHGHRVPEIDDAIRDQLDRIAHSTLLGLTHEPAARLAKELVEITPKRLTRVFYSDSGSEAIEIALKIAFQYWRQCKSRSGRKQKFISLKNAYHGDTIGSVSVGGIDLFHQIYESLLFDTLFVSAPYCYRCPVGHAEGSCCMKGIDEIERLMARHKRDIAGLIIEPVMQGAAGMVLQPPGFLKKVQDLCRKYDILLIADCVAVGFGRTGKMFACEHEGIEPDIMAVAKGLTGGYLPLAATLTSEKVYEAFLGEYHETKTFFHGHTYTGNPLACRAALANLELFRKNKTLQKLGPKIKLFSKLLSRFTQLEHVGEIRQRGMMVGIELVKQKKTKTPYTLKDRIGQRVVEEARLRGVIIRPLGNVIVLMPPLVIEAQDLTFLCDTTYDAIQMVTDSKP